MTKLKDAKSVEDISKQTLSLEGRLDTVTAPALEAELKQSLQHIV